MLALLFAAATAVSACQSTQELSAERGKKVKLLAHPKV